MRNPALLPLLLLLRAGLEAQTDTQFYVNAQLPYHHAVVDQTGKLLAWYLPERNQGYQRVLQLGWDFIEHKVPVDTEHQTGLKIYLINSVFDPSTLQGINWQHNPAMLYASFVDSLVGWYPYSGDEESIRVVRSMLDYQLQHGTTPADWKWAGVPFATACGNRPSYGDCLQNMPADFHGGIETDKVAELGLGYLQFYELSGERKYLEASLSCANALAGHVRAGDAEHTPWAFRVDARTGVTLALEEYGGNIAAAVRFFDELLLLEKGDVASYKRARKLAWQWTKDFPMNRATPAWNRWSGYFEDVVRGTDRVNQVLPMSTAYTLLNTNFKDAQEKQQAMAQAGQLIDWVRNRFGRGPFFGAWGIDEQGFADGRGCCSRSGEGSHTARWAAINALYFARTKDGQAREDAFRSLNYATYFAADDGRISCCGSDYHHVYWFSDGYSDYLRHFTAAMGAVPEFAPIGEDHLLHSTSVVKKIRYAPGRVDYETFFAHSDETLTLSFDPATVKAGGVLLMRRDDLAGEGYTLGVLANGNRILKIRHSASEQISILAK